MTEIPVGVATEFDRCDFMHPCPEGCGHGCCSRHGGVICAHGWMIKPAVCCPACGTGVHLEQWPDSGDWVAVEESGKVHRCSHGVRWATGAPS